MKYFNTVKNIQELKKAYRKLAQQFHPDHNKDASAEEIMKSINAEYAEMLERFQNGYSNVEEDSKNQETPETFVNIVNELLKIDGINIELCGVWLWISGNTYANKEVLKRLGCGYSKNKKRWYWHEGEYSKRSKHKVSMEEIKMKYGSINLKHSTSNCALSKA